ncbi:MAG TPA: phytanoyl-CoA dioxygenase family protein [Blastocatellia bacterium]|jgi:ectoine hydroxylase|nr:phytanoyl-CoA dioxygenase family protein [Blastocatellia bacterium]
MYITEAQLKQYDKTGFLFLPEFFSSEEVSAMKAELPGIFAEDSPRRVLEKDGNMVRSVYGSHNDNEVFKRLVRLPRIVGPVVKFLGSEVYVYQFKINTKAAFGGDRWEWHQDYEFWRKEDGMPVPRVINVVVYLNEVNEFNGPMFLIPCSHHEGSIDVDARDAAFADKKSRPKVYEDSPTWISNLTADLKYSLSQPVVEDLVRKYGIVAPKGQAGSVLFFHGNLVHGSSNNISPFDRVLVFITFNSVQNFPSFEGNKRPDFIVCHDGSPIVPLQEDALIPKP